MASDAFTQAYMALIPRLDSKAKKDIENDVADAGDKAGSRFGSALSAGVKTAGVAIAASMAALGKIAADSFAAYADFEQLVGGVEKLFGGEDSEAALMVQKFAQDAYRTAGLSANEYMETVTGFSAALIQSLEGDTVTAAEVANRAIMDMSDNANTMGTDMASIQAAYQGFAKGNFTMLDNLKLGYGGTRTEMERLIADANALREQQGLTADLTIDSYADIVEAIHTVQEDMQITGKTAEEASGTIQGSLSAVKASWQNLLVGLADDESALGGLVETFLQNVVTFAQNALPRLTVIVESIGEMLPSMIDMVIGYMQTDIIPLFESLIRTIIDHIPDFIQAGVTLLVSIVKDLPAIVTGVIAVIPDIVDALVDTLLDPDNILMFLDVGYELFMGIADGIWKALPRLLKKAIEGLGGLVDGVLEWLGIKSPSRMFAEIGDYCMQGLGVGFGEGLPDAKSAMHDAIGELTGQAQAEIQITAAAGTTAAHNGISNNVSIGNLTIQADSRTTAESVFAQIRMAAGIA